MTMLIRQAETDVTETQLIEDWLADVDGSPDTTKTYRKGLEQFTEWTTSKDVQDLNQLDLHSAADVIRQFRDDLYEDYSAATVNLRLSALRSFFAWSVRRGLTNHNPADHVKGIKRSGTTKRHKRDELTPDEVKRLFKACDDGSTTGVRDKALIALMAYTGLRTIEVHRANLEDLRTEQGRQVLEVRSKGAPDKDDIVVIPEPLETILAEWLATREDAEDSNPLFISLSNNNRGARMSRQAIRRMVKKRMASVGIKDGRKTTHSLRHAAISTAIRNGATPEQAQAMARHANITTTMTYYHEINRVEDPAEDLISFE